MGRERRRRIRRASEQPAVSESLPEDGGTPLPASEGAPRTTRVPRSSVRTGHGVHVRSERTLEREAALMVYELKRVLAISGVCLGMLAALVLVDRLA